ncbi:response regulator [Polyangium aurulentum]|uniref:response regulator n=1 Tax=Polyangium aurulentum TaxID=2567896 RepID=UPI0010AED4CB|nr:response regulator [Polyangium aurulentum]UQA62557.1 response regulator [Polyangium aurulentum]
MSKQSLVLVVDDDVRTARLFVRMLREDGFQVELAHDGAAAIGRLGRAPLPDVLVTDLSMPHADGLAVAKYAQACRPGLPVFLVTGYPDLVARRMGSLDPEPQVFTKPVDYDELSTKLVQALIGK